MNSRAEVLEHLSSCGVVSRFKPRIELETGDILLECRKPAKIVEGALHGTEIAIYDLGRMFQVWTSHKSRGMAIAQSFGLRIRLLDGECEVFVPYALADELLPRFGAKVKRRMSEKQKAVLDSAREKANLARSKL